MIRKYKFGYRLVAWLLLIVVFVEGCGNSNLYPRPQREEEIKISSNHLTAQQLGYNTFIDKEKSFDLVQVVSNELQLFKNQSSIKQLIGKEFTASGGHLVTFDEQGGKLRAGVIINTPKGFSKAYINLPVSIVKGIDVAQLTYLNKEEQKRVIHFNSSKHGQQASISVFKEGLVGGMKKIMKKGDEDQERKKEEEQEKEQEKRGAPYLSIKTQKGIENDSWFREALFADLPRGYELGRAYDDGDCFFDALAQWLNKINHTDVNTVKYLRMLCHDFYLKNKELVNSWNQQDYGGIDKGKDDYYMIQYTAEECDRLFNGRAPVWGRPWIEGKILCKELHLKGICVIEVLKDPETGKAAPSYHWIAQGTYKGCISKEEGQALVKEGTIPVLVNIQGKLHFVPLWKKVEVLEKQVNLSKGRDKEKEKEEMGKASQAIPRLNDIRELRRYFTKGYLGIIPRNYKQLIEYSEKYASSFMSYEGGVFVKGWERSNEFTELVDLLLSFSKIKKFRFNCIREDAAELVGKAVQFYEELVELDLNGCQLSDVMTEDILESIVAPEKLRLLDVSNNNLSEEMLDSLRGQFSNAQVISNLSPLSPLSGLPSIAYNNQALEEVMNEIPMSPLEQRTAELYLKNIRQKMDEIKRYKSTEHTEHFYHPMKEAILEIHNTTRSLYELAKPYHPTLSNTLRSLILQSIASFEGELNKRLEMSVEGKEALRIKTKRLYAEQSYIARPSQGELQGKLIEHLDKIKQLLTEVGTPPLRCYISYAWPSKENQREEYWVQPFLYILYDHLTAAGIRVIMDIRDNKPGDSIYKFMKQCHTADYVILVGTESLLQKYRSTEYHMIKTELSIISKKFEQDQKKYGSGLIYPLLISGSSKTSFPAIYDKYRTVRDAREMGGYVLMLRRLLDWICQRQIIRVQTQYENLWRDFNKNCPGLPVETDSQAIEQELSIGYHGQKLKYLKQDLQFQTVQVQEQASHSSAVDAKMADVLLESQGNNFKLLYSEYGQQFQRPSMTPDFIEREGLWNKIVSHFDHSEQQILTLIAHGLAGMGKTELARYYYLCPPRPYALRAWFNADNKEQLYSQYVDLARAHGIEYEEKKPIEEQARQVKNWLDTQKDCLLVYDNAPDAKQLEGLLPVQGKHHILITSRNEVAWPAHQKLDVDVMEEQEAIALICKITGCKEETIRLKELIRTLNYLPLALVQAGAYIAEKQTSIENYLKRYREYQSILMSDEALSRNLKHEPMWGTFNMNFQALEEDCPSALLTLKQASWLDASAVPELLLKMMLKSTREEPLELFWEDVKEHIGRYSLMRIDREGYQLSMHRLLQDILRSKQDEIESKEILNQIALSIKSIYPERDDKTKEDIALVRLLLPHIETVLSHLKKFFNESECTNFNLEFYLGDAYETIGHYMKAKEYFYADLLIKQRRYNGNHIQTKEDNYTSNQSYIAILLDKLGRVCNSLAEYQAALNYLEQALAMGQALYNGNHSDIARSLNNVGSVYQELGKYQEALNYHHQALEMKHALYPGNHLSIAISLDNIGLVYQALGQPQKALKYYKEALKMRQALYRDNYPDIANSLNNIGNVYATLGQYKRALKYYKEALKMRQALYSSDHPDIAISLYDLGKVSNYLGKYQKALKYLEQALKILRTLYKGNHPAIATSLNNIGGIYDTLGEYEKALTYYEQALEMRKALYKGNHPAIATSLNNIGGIYDTLGEYEKALAYLEQTLEMRKALYNGNHPDIATSLNNIGGIYDTLGEHEKALAYLEPALEMMKALFKGNHPDIATSLNNIGLVYNNLGEHKKALAYYEQALEMRKALYNGNHPDIATSLNNIGGIYDTLGEHKKALAYLERALEMMKALFKGNHPAIATSLNNIGLVYNNLGQHEKALAYYEPALEMRKALYNGNHPDIATSLNNIGLVYDALGEHEKALAYYEQDLEMMKALFKGNHPAIAASLNNIGGIYDTLGEYEKALTYYKEALKMRQALYNDNHPVIATSLNNIGLVYNNLGQHQEALKYCKQAVEMYQAIYTGNHPDVAYLMNNIGNIYKALGQHQEALKYLKQALEMNQVLYPGDHSDIATSLNNIGNTYEKYQVLHTGNHPYMASSLNNLGMVYQDLGQNEEALKYYQRSLKMYQDLYPHEPKHPGIQKVKQNITKIQSWCVIS